MNLKLYLPTFMIAITLLTESATFPQINNLQNIRPIRDSIGFCWNADEMNHFINYLSETNPDVKPIPQKLVAAISVHDDYLYAGNVYYPLYQNIKTKEVVIFGVTHGTVRKELGPQSNVLILDNYTKWQGPYGDVEISPLREIIKSKLLQNDFIVSNKAHSIEHSIEALIPFLQYYNRDIKITPIMVTQMPMERMEDLSNRLSEIIIEYAKSKNLKLGEDIFFLISNDANHYGEDFSNAPYGMDAKAHKLATENDQRIIKQDLVDKITDEKIFQTAKDILPDTTNKFAPLWCGRYPIVFGLMTISKVVKEIDDKDMFGKLFKYSDTFTEKVLPVKNTSMGLTAVFSYKHWCGWFTDGFYTH
ncbi:MAG TPA: AmmeMemoRadiSam system protein B [Ignavibacteriaceae bacterium]|nr:AmmeMemoRadiSam system protein B [Ignavibacteriaceae bacterium]